MPLGTEVGLGQGDIVLDGDPVSSRKGTPQSENTTVLLWYTIVTYTILHHGSAIYHRKTILYYKMSWYYYTSTIVYHSGALLYLTTALVLLWYTIVLHDIPQHSYHGISPVVCLTIYALATAFALCA